MPASPIITPEDTFAWIEHQRIMRNDAVNPNLTAGIGTVGTSQVATDAITHQLNSAAAGFTALTLAADNTLVSISVTSTGGNLLIVGKTTIFFSLTAAVASNGFSTAFFARNGSILTNSLMQVNYNGTPQNSGGDVISLPVSPIFVDAPAAGTYTYSLVAHPQNNTNISGADAYYSFIAVIEFKR